MSLRGADCARLLIRATKRDFLDSRADVFLLCPLISQKWTVR
jgi:hypothetical protein